MVGFAGPFESNNERQPKTITTANEQTRKVFKTTLLFSFDFHTAPNYIFV